MNILDKWRAQPGSNRRLLIETLVLLALMWILISWVPFRWILRFFRLTPGSSGEGFPPRLADQVARIGWAIQAAAAHTPWPSTCLAKALCGMIMLRRRGVSSTLYLGITRDSAPSRQRGAHAWLRCGQDILTGAGEKERYVRLASFTPC